MSLQDYATRRYDLLAFENVKPDKESQLNLVLFSENNSGQICTGIQKLSQRWMLEFLTEVGSMIGKPDRGCEFMRNVRFGYLRSATDIFYAFARSAFVVRQNLQKEETDAMPNDERLDNAEFISVAFLPGYAQMKIAITSLAGDTREVIMPVSTLP
jgi:hypothetical protein